MSSGSFWLTNDELHLGRGVQMKKLYCKRCALGAWPERSGEGGRHAGQGCRTAPVYTWTGCYVGVQIGYKWGYSKQTYGGSVQRRCRRLPAGRH